LVLALSLTANQALAGCPFARQYQEPDATPVAAADPSPPRRVLRGGGGGPDSSDDYAATLTDLGAAYVLLTAAQKLAVLNAMLVAQPASGSW
jgi:hypothetical protein